MANATHDISVRIKSLFDATLPTQADKLYAGTMVTRNTSGQVGVIAAGERLMGINLVQVDNSSGTAGDLGAMAKVARQFILQAAVSGASAGQEGQAVFLGADNQTLSLNPKKGGYLGQIISFYPNGDAVIYCPNPGNSTWTTWRDVADDGTIDLPDAQQGVVWVVGGGEHILASVAADATVASLAASTNTAVADTDAKLCVFDGGTAATIKNRLGASKRLQIVYMGVQV